MRIVKVSPTDSAIRKGIMEKLRAECEARGQHLPEVPSLKTVAAFPMGVDGDMGRGADS